jgi:hypothetical protein
MYDDLQSRADDLESHTDPDPINEAIGSVVADKIPRMVHRFNEPRFPKTLSYEYVHARSLKAGSLADMSAERWGFAFAPLISSGPASGDTRLYIVVTPTKQELPDFSPYESLQVEGRCYSIANQKQEVGGRLVAAPGWDEVQSQLLGALAFIRAPISDCYIHVMNAGGSVSGTSAGAALMAALCGICENQWAFSSGYFAKSTDAGSTGFYHGTLAGLSRKMAVAPKIICFEGTYSSKGTRMGNVPLEDLPGITAPMNWQTLDRTELNAHPEWKMLPYKDEAALVSFYLAEAARDTAKDLKADQMKVQAMKDEAARSLRALEDSKAEKKAKQPQDTYTATSGFPNTYSATSGYPSTFSASNMRDLRPATPEKPRAPKSKRLVLPEVPTEFADFQAANEFDVRAYAFAAAMWTLTNVNAGWVPFVGQVIAVQTGHVRNWPKSRTVRGDFTGVNMSKLAAYYYNNAYPVLMRTSIGNKFLNNCVSFVGAQKTPEVLQEFIQIQTELIVGLGAEFGLTLKLEQLPPISYLKGYVPPNDPIAETAKTKHPGTAVPVKQQAPAKLASEPKTKKSQVSSQGPEQRATVPETPVTLSSADRIPRKVNKKRQA